MFIMTDRGWQRIGGPLVWNASNEREWMPNFNGKDWREAEAVRDAIREQLSDYEAELNS